MTSSPAGAILAAAAISMALFCAASGPATADAGGGLAVSGAPGYGRLARPVAVFGSDDRVVLGDKIAGLGEKIGLLYDRQSRSVCTAFCVSDRVIATAGHCVFRTSEEAPPSLSGFEFRLGGVRARSRSPIAGGKDGAGAQYITAGAMRINTRPPIDASRDWALLRLAKPICAKHILPLTRRSPDELTQLSLARKIYQVAYHRDFGNWKLALGPACEIKRDFTQAPWGSIARDFTEAKHLVLHRCDTGGASSGSPLLTDGPNGAEVVGIIVGTYVQSRVQMQDGKVIKRFKSDTIANTGVSTSAFAGRLEAFHAADILAKRDDMKHLQVLLAARGLYAGTADGVYGPQLRAAIEAFEREENKPVTGLATTVLLQRLNATAAGAAKPAVMRIESKGLTSRGQKADDAR